MDLSTEQIFGWTGCCGVALLFVPVATAVKPRIICSRFLEQLVTLFVFLSCAETQEKSVRTMEGSAGGQIILKHALYWRILLVGP